MKKTYVIFLINLYACVLHSYSSYSIQEKVMLEEIKIKINALYAAEKKNKFSLSSPIKKEPQHDFSQERKVISSLHDSIRKNKKEKKRQKQCNPHKTTNASDNSSTLLPDTILTAAPIESIFETELNQIEFYYEFNENSITLLLDFVPPSSPITDMFEEKILYNTSTLYYKSHFCTHNPNNQNE